MAEKISYIPQQPIVPQYKPGKVATSRKSTSPDKKETDFVPFENLLQERIADQEKIKFSNHAQQRLRMRNIQFSPQQMERLTDAVERAARKGVRDSLLLVDNIAAVVSVQNRTIVTVMGEDSLKDNVFTNIDSAVIA